MLLLKKLIRLVGSYSDWLPSASCYVAIICLAAMTLLITFETISRTFFNFSTLVADEMGGYAMVWITFLGLAYCLKTGGHIRVEAIINRVSPMIRDILSLISYLGATIFSFIIAYTSYNFVIDSYTIGARSAQISRIPMYIPQLIVPIGMAVLILQLIFEGYQASRSLKRRMVRRQGEEVSEEKGI